MNSRELSSHIDVVNTIEYAQCRRLVKDELVRMCKEAVIAQFAVLARKVSGGAEETHGTYQ